LAIARLYKVVLLLSITLQLAVFFIVVTSGLWIDQLFNGAIGTLAEHKTVYRVIFTLVLIVLLPWLVTGWISIRRELKLGMAVFLALCVMYSAGTGAMFSSDTFRWTFITWTFFAVMVTASAVLTLVCFLLGLVCRFNFGKGLSNHLHAQQRLDDNDPSPQADDIEKFAFPDMNSRVPTFDFNEEATPPTQMVFVPTRESTSFNSPSLMRTTTVESEISLARSDSGRSTTDAVLGRSNSQTSQASNGSNSSNNSGRSKRWVIE